MNELKRGNVLCAGLALCDILVKPVTPDSLRGDTCFVEHIGITGGGDAFNVAFNLAAMGVPVSLASKFGNDDLGAWLLNKIRGRGIKDEITVTDSVRTSASVVAIRPDCERSFLVYRGACHAMTQEDVTDAQLARHDIFYLGSAFDLPGIDNVPNALATLFQRARKQGCFTVLDVTGDLTPRQMDVLRPALPFISLFIPSRGEALNLTGEATPEAAAAAFHALGCETVAIKLGAEGSLVLSNNRCVKLPAYPAHVVDTTGAGDAFVSGFIAAFTKGMSFEDCARFGNAAGAVCVSAIGANGALQSFSQVEKIAALP